MDEKVLVIKRKQGDLFKVKVAKAVKGRYGEVYYKNVINLKDYKALARLLQDLESVCGAPVDQAFREKQRKKSPFFLFFHF
jgi:DNA polymerase II large subunit